jgi:predicted DNA-binding transcriptional regulator AlpA
MRYLVLKHEASMIETAGSHALGVRQLCERLGGGKPLNPSTLWRRIRRDPGFPKPFYLWDSAPRFVEAEVDAYIARKIAERDDPICAAAQRERLARREQRTGEARAQARKSRRIPFSKERRSIARPTRIPQEPS